MGSRLRSDLERLIPMNTLYYGDNLDVMRKVIRDETWA